MNWIDLIILILLLLFVFEGLGRGFLGELLDFGSFLLAFFMSIRFYNQVSLFLQSNFQVSHSLANVLGFIFVWFMVETVFFIVIHSFLSRFWFLVKFDRMLRPLSVFPAVLRGVIFIAILLILIGTFPIQPRFKLAVNQSRIGSFILSKTQQLESPLKVVFGGITQDTFSFLTIEPKSDESVSLGFQTNDFSPNAVLEDKMIELVNHERVSRGLSLLHFDMKLRDVARFHSSDMFKRGYFSHYSPEGKTVVNRAESFGVNYQVIGENLAYAPTLDLAHTGLMNSEGHRANILSPDFNKIGIGIMDGMVYGLMITQVFTN